MSESSQSTFDDPCNPIKDNHGNDSEQMNGTNENGKENGTFTTAFHRLETVLVETIKDIYDEKCKVQNDAYLNEIGALKGMNQGMKKEHEKEVSLILEKHTLKEQHLQKEIDLSARENDSLKKSASRLQGQYDKCKNENVSLSQLHEKNKTELEKVMKELESHRVTLDADKREMKKQKEEFSKLYQENISLRQDIEKFESAARKYRAEIEKAHDEIIILKNTIGAAESQNSQFTECRSKSKSGENQSEMQPEKIYLKNDHDPLSNMYIVNEGINIYTHSFISSEHAYQWRKAVYSNDFTSAEKIKNAKDGYKAKKNS